MAFIYLKSSKGMGPLNTRDGNEARSSILVGILPLEDKYEFKRNASDIYPRTEVIIVNDKNE
jgi:hypothetical protein